MYYIISLYILLFSASYIDGVWCDSWKHEDLKNKDSRIIKGSAADIKNYPYMTKLEITNETRTYQCGGCIISNYSILTAAHCLEKMKVVKVRIGSSYSNNGGYEYLTISFYQHPRFNIDTLDYDIGVVNVAEGMRLDGENSSILRIASISNDPPEGEHMTLTGWGKTGPNDDVSETLQEATVQVVNRTYCNSRIRGITRRMFCAGSGDVNSCQGDSGSPAVGESYVLNGVTSFGVGCGVQDYPVVYTRVGHPLIRTFITTMTGV